MILRLNTNLSSFVDSCCRQSQTRYQLAVVELFLSGMTLGAVLEVLRVDLRYDPD